jgi:flagellar motor switch protein FliN/FliY
VDVQPPTASEQLERLADAPAAPKPAAPPADPPRRRADLPNGLEALRDLELAAVVELGRSTLTVEDLSELRVGGLIALDNTAGHALDLYVNGSLFARGEVVAINENYGLRITEIVNVRAGT